MMPFHQVRVSLLFNSKHYFWRQSNVMGLHAERQDEPRELESRLQSLKWYLWTQSTSLKTKSHLITGTRHPNEVKIVVFPEF